MKQYLSFFAIVFLPCLGSLAEAPPRLNLAPNPSFEEKPPSGIGWYPVGLANEVNSALALTDECFRSGTHSLKVHVCPDEIVCGTESYSSYNGGEGVRYLQNQRGVYGARTIAYRMDRDVQSFHASIWVHASSLQDISLEVRWFARFGRKRPLEWIHTDSSNRATQTEDSWTKLEIDSIRPANAHQAQLVVANQGKAPFFIDDVQIDLIRAEGSLILVDQVGYEIGSFSKFALFQQNTLQQETPSEYQIIQLESQKEVQRGSWRSLGYHPQFDRFYWRADFNELDQPGQYVIRTQIGKEIFFSDPFCIADAVVENGIARLAYEFFYYQRCGMEIPGFHAACHMDDAVFPDKTSRDLSGGWHDAGDYNKYNGYTPESFYALIQTYDRKKSFFDRFDRNGDGVADLLDEALWGAKFLEKCLNAETMQLIGVVSTGYRYWGTPDRETDNLPASGDERPVSDWNGSPAFLPAAFALLSQYVPEKQHYLELAEKIYEKRGGSLRDLLTLYHASGKEVYKTKIDEIVSNGLKSPDGGSSQFRELGEYCLCFPESEWASQIKQLASQKLAQVKEQCDPYFGLRMRTSRAGEKIYFMDYQKVNDWCVGESRELLDAAYEGLLLDKLGFPEGRTIAENQLHWILGRNPFATSMMEGAGRRFVPQYHHRYNTLPACPNGAVPGAVINGIVRSWPWTDRPWLDLDPIPTAEYQCNEPWLPHNNRMLWVVSLWR